MSQDDEILLHKVLQNQSRQPATTALGLHGAQQVLMFQQAAAHLGNRDLSHLLAQGKLGSALQLQEVDEGESEESTTPEVWGERSSVAANDVTIEVFGASETEKKIIGDTLSLLPRRHLELIPRIVVNERVGPVGPTGSVTKGGNSVRNGDAERDRIELTTYSLENKLKEISSTHLKACITLLHEIGHWVDWELTILPPRDSDEWEILNIWYQELAYEGVTQGIGERAAEAYWRYFASRLPDEIKDILNKSPAFTEILGR